MKKILMVLVLFWGVISFGKNKIYTDFNSGYIEVQGLSHIIFVNDYATGTSMQGGIMYNEAHQKLAKLLIEERASHIKIDRVHTLKDILNKLNAKNIKYIAYFVPNPWDEEEAHLIIEPKKGNVSEFSIAFEVNSSGRALPMIIFPEAKSVYISTSNGKGISIEDFLK